MENSMHALDVIRGLVMDEINVFNVVMVVVTLINFIAALTRYNLVRRFRLF